MLFNVKSLVLTSFGILAVSATVAQPQKAVLVSYPHDTPDSILDQAKSAIIAAGGVITHEYTLIKAFAANAPAEALSMVQTLSNQYEVTVEEDQMVSISDSN